jgi:transcriptional regulator with GAF, ATPase, and Fis domain
MAGAWFPAAPFLNLKKIASRMGIREFTLKGRHVPALKKLLWPGSVRELQNVIGRTGELRCNSFVV